jgi:hypothetical protein
MTIKKVNNRYILLSHNYKRLGVFSTIERAKKREKQIQYFKNLNKL